MPTTNNEYDEIIDGPPASPPNEYEAIVTDDRNQQKSSLQQSMYAAHQGPDPDRQAKIMELAKQTNLPPGVIDRQFDKVNKDVAVTNTDYDDMIDKTPGLASWLQNPQNATVAKDDLDSLSAVEKTVSDHSMASSMYSALNSGLAGLYSSVAKVPALVYDTAAWPQNAFNQAIGRDVEVKSPEWLRNNVITERYDNAQKAFTTPDMEKSVTDQLSKGDYSGAGKSLAVQFVANAPQQAAMIVAMMTGFGEAALVGAGATTAATANAENQANPNLTAAQGVGNALAKGTIEAGFESIGTFGVLKHWEGAIAQQYGKEVSKSVMKDLTKTLAYTVAAEGNEEALTSVAQDMTDYVTGVNPDALTGIGQRALDAGVIGGVSGGLMTGPSAFGSGLVRGQAIRQANLSKDFYTQLGDTVDQTKLSKRSPEAQKEYIDHITKGTSVENVYIPVEAMDAYFQSAKINPAKVAQDLGVLDQYNQAKETGTDLQVPLSDWVTKIDREHYHAMANDVKFSPEGRTLTEAKAESEQLKSELENVDTEAVANTRNVEQEIGAVKTDVKEQLKISGFTEKEASRQAELYGSFFSTLSSKAPGVSPMELYQKYGLTIRSVDLNEATESSSGFKTPGEGGTTLNQSAVGGMMFQVNKLDNGIFVINPMDSSSVKSKIIGDTMRIHEIKTDPKYKTVSRDILRTLEKTALKYGATSITASMKGLTDSDINAYEAYGFLPFEDPNSGELVMKKPIQPSIKITIEEDARKVLYQSDAGVKENAPEFYSKLQQTIEQKMGGSATPKEIEGMIKEMKPEERKWSGIDEFMKGKEKIPKPELIEFLRANQIEIKDVVKGTQQNEADAKSLPSYEEHIRLDLEKNPDLSREDAESRALGSALGRAGGASFPRNIDQHLRQEYRDATGDQESRRSDTKFSEYTLPGGENYKEVLFQLPERKIAEPLTELPDGFEVKESKVPKFGKEGTSTVYSVLRPDGGNQLAPGSESPEKAIEVALRSLNKEISQQSDRDINYKSSHFDETNVLAHVRINDRVDSDGKKVLFVEEIQSDWHQEGRKKGYKGDEPPLVTREQAIDQLESYEDSLIEKYAPQGVTMKDFKSVKTKDVAISGERTIYENLFDDPTMRFQIYKEGNVYTVYHGGTTQGQFKTQKEVNANLDEIIKNKTKISDISKDVSKEENDKRSELIKQLNKSEGVRSKVPDAPFRKTWHEFALKKLLRMAAEGGYDKIAWTTGEQQAERYDLSKKIDSLGYKKNGDDSYSVSINLPHGDGAPKNYTESQLEETVGKDIAKKIVESSTDKNKKLSGVDLKVGGEGMKGFYDKIVPDFLKKFTKKYGAEVGETTLPGIESKYPGTTGVSPGKVHSLEITPQLKDAALNEGFSLFQPGEGGEGPKRGQITFGDSRQFNIDLLKDADLSTFLHETGHFFLEVFGDLAQNEGATKNVTDDYQAVLDWLGVKSRDEITTEHHEKWARGFEAYLMEGKAPTKALRKAFETFKVWLTNIYRQINNLDVVLTDDVRGVMDRLLASDEQISGAEQAMNYAALYPDPVKNGMSPTQSERYQNAMTDARQSSVNTIREHLMDDLQKRDKAFYKNKREEVKAEITKELHESKEYRALSILQTGLTPDGKVQTDSVIEGAPLKISKDSVVELLGKDLAKEIPRGVTSKDGQHIEVVAEYFGFDNGTLLAKALQNIPTLKDAINQQTDSRMNELYPDNINDPKLSERAVEAVHNDNRAKVLRMELEHLAANNMPVLKDVIRQVARRVPTEMQVREQAESILGSKVISDIKPIVYQRAEVKAAKEAGQLLAKGDIEGAFQAKRKELLNHELYRESIKAREQIKKDTIKFKKMFKSEEDLAKTRDVDLVNAAKAVLAQFGITKSEKTAEEYLKNMKSYDPDTYGTVIALVEGATQGAGQIETIKYDDFIAMSDAVNALWDLSRTSHEIEIDGVRMNREQVKGEMQSRLAEISKPGEKHKYQGSETTGEAIKTALLSFKAAVRRVEHWALAVDGPAKEFTKYLWRPISQAADKYRIEKNSVLKEYKKTFEILDRKSLTNKSIEASEISDIPFRNKAELLGAILHTGNDSNLQKLLVGRGWGTLNEDGSLNRTQWDQFIQRMVQSNILTKSDYDWAQAVWNLNETLKPGAQKAHKKMYGFYFNEVTANVLNTPWGEYRGGYVPAVADPMKSEKATIRNEKEQMERGQNSFMFPTTGRGFTKSRVENYAAPLSLDVNLVGGHIDKVLRFTHIEPHVKEVSRIVMDDGFRQSLAQLDPAAGADMLVPWLQRSAAQRTTFPTGNGRAWKVADSIFSKMRLRAGMNIMAANTINVLQNYTGIIVGAAKIDLKYMRNATWDYITNSKAISEQAVEKSEFMESQLKNEIHETQNDINDIILNPGTAEKVRDFAARNAYIFQKLSQNQNNIIIWNAAYNQSLENGVAEKEAVRDADSAVRTTQSSLSPEDVSRFETGNPFFRMFTQFYSYFNNLANLNASEYERIVRDMGIKKGAGRLIYLFLVATYLPAVLSEVIRVSLSGKGFDEDDDDNYMDDFMSIFFASPAKFLGAQIPFVGQAAQTFSNTWNDKHYDDKLNLSPSISIIENMVKAPSEIYEAISHQNKQNKAIRDTLTALGVATGVPLGAAARPLTYLNDIRTGEAEPKGAIDFVRGAVTGKNGKQ